MIITFAVRWLQIEFVWMYSWIFWCWDRFREKAEPSSATWWLSAVRQLSREETIEGNRTERPPEDRQTRIWNKIIKLFFFLNRPNVSVVSNQLFKIFFGVPYSTAFIFVIFLYAVASIAYIHPVYSVGVWTHNLLIMSHLP